MRLYWLCVLPLVLLGAWLAYDNVRTARSVQDQQASVLARNFVAAIDQQLRAHINSLQVMANSSHLDRPGELGQLYKDGISLKESVGMDVVLVETGKPPRMLFNTVLPFDAPLPPLPASEWFQALPAAISTLRPAVSDHLYSAVTQEPFVVVAVPALRDGQAKFVLASPIEVRALQRTLNDFSLPDGWALTLRDRAGYTLARYPLTSATGVNTPSMDQFIVGSPISEWTASLEVSTESRNAPIWSTSIALGMLLLAATLTGVLAGMAGGRRLSKAVASLASGETPSDLKIVEIQAAKALLEKTAEREQLSEVRFRRIFQDTPIGMRLTDNCGNILAQNAVFEKMFGYQIHEVPTVQAWMNRAYPDPARRRHVEQVWKSIVESGTQNEQKVFLGEFYITTKDGRGRHVQARSSLLPDGLITSFNDITEQRETEARLRLWAQAFEHVPLNLAIGNPISNTLAAANPAFAAARGYTSEEMVGMPVIDLYPQEIQGDILNTVAQMAQTPHYSLESEHIRKDGSRFPVLLDATVLFDSRGTPVSRLVYSLDLTERRLAEAELQALHDNLERRVSERTAQLTRANHELDSFAYTVSHDLRAPLRAMDGFLHLLREEYGQQLPEEGLQHLDKINGAIGRMKSLMEGILTLTHSARSELNRSSVNLSELVLKHLNVHAAAEPDRKLQLEVQPNLFVEADVSMMSVVVINLVDNAWKYTSKTETAHIRFFADHRDGQVWFCLADNGAGFDAGHAGKLFQPFQRLHRHEEFPGIGIGLATVQRVVQRHSGQIVAEGEPGKGALFRFTLQPASCSAGALL